MRFKRFRFFSILIIVLVSTYPALPQTQRSERFEGIVPSVLTLPAGTLVRVRTTQLLSSDQNRPGDEFTVTLDEPMIVQGWVVARTGQTVIGKVVEAQKAGRGQSNSLLTIELREMVLVDGQQAPIRTELVQVLGRGSLQNQQLATVGATTGIGAAIGGMAGGGEGAAIGAAIGAVAGMAGAMSTRGRPTEIYPETGLAFRLQEPVSISTENSRQAFLPVEQRDYRASASRNPERYLEERVPAPRRIYVYNDPYYFNPYYHYPYDYRYGPSYGLSVYWGSPYYYAGPRYYVQPGHGRHR
jgi:hypothetical protein